MKHWSRQLKIAVKELLRSAREMTFSDGGVWTTAYAKARALGFDLAFWNG